METSAQLRARAIALTSKPNFTAEQGAQAKTLMSLADSLANQEARDHAAALSGELGIEPKRKHRQPVGDISSPDFRHWLSTGEVRAGISTEGTDGGAYPSSSSGFFAPILFKAAIVEAMKALDGIWADDVSTILNTRTNASLNYPGSSDVANPATAIGEADEIPQVNTLMFGVNLEKAPVYKSSLAVSLEYVQDSGLSIDAYLATRFPVRFQRGAGPTIIAALLAGATQTVTAAGSSGNDGSMNTGADSIGSDDIADLIQSADAAYANAQRSFLAMNWNTLTSVLATKSKQGNLVFPGKRDPDTGRYECFGREVIVCPSLPNIAANAKTIVFGDFSRLLIRLGPMTISMSAETAGMIEYGQYLFRSTMGIQGTVLVDTSLSPVDSPFVYLQQAAS